MKDIVIADHHPITRKGIACLLKKHDGFKIVGKARDRTQLYEKLHKHKPDLLVLEIDMPKLGGINSIRSIKAEFPHVNVLVFSCHPQEIYALSSIKSGAAGYVPKTAPNSVLLKAIKRTAKGGIYINEELTTGFTKHGKGQRTALGHYKKLSSREIEVLNLLSSGKRNKDIANTLHINEKTVSTYKTRMLKKLRVDNLADLIHQSRLFQ
ncbi:MAG: response regulator [Marinirhabdus sp.]